MLHSARSNVLARTSLGFSAIALMCAAGLAHGDDLFRPAFRGNPGSTLECWDFDQDPIGPPDGDCCDPEQNMWGASTATTNGMWLPDYAGLQGIVCLGDGQSIVHTVPNNLDPTAFKTVVVQVTFHRHFDGTGFSDLQIGVAGGVAVQQNDVGVPGEAPEWVHRTMMFSMFPCPPVEQITMTATGGHVDVGQVVIDTECDPRGEPIPFPQFPGDFDGDGWPDTIDNDPYNFNPLQEDADGDGVGDGVDCDFNVQCNGDLDGDNDTDFGDLNVLLVWWGVGSGGDLDGDLDTDFDDLNLLLIDFGCTP